MSFFLFSRSQKRDTNANKKFFNLNNKIINKESNHKDNKGKNIYIKDKSNNRNIYSYIRNNEYKYSNNINIQVDVKKGQINSLNENKKKLIEVTSNINYFSTKKDNIDYILLNESLSDKEKYLQYLKSLEDNNILNGLFGNFFLLNTKKDIYINSLNDEKFILSKLNKIINFKGHKLISNVTVKKGINKNNLNFKNVNKNLINSKIL